MLNIMINSLFHFWNFMLCLAANIRRLWHLGWSKINLWLFILESDTLKYLDPDLPFFMDSIFSSSAAAEDDTERNIAHYSHSVLVYHIVKRQTCKQINSSPWEDVIWKRFGLMKSLPC